MVTTEQVRRWLREPRPLKRQLPFNEIAAIQVITSENDELPPNIRVACGNDRMEQYANAISIIRNDLRVNAVIVLSPAKNGVSEAMSKLRKLTVPPRFRTTLPASELVSTETITARVAKYIEARRTDTKSIDSLGSPSNDNIVPISEAWRAAASYPMSISGTTLLKSTLVYVPEYFLDKCNGYINAHIDFAHQGFYDVRIIETMAGSGTILFRDDDFTLSDDECLNRDDMLKNTDLVKCWAVATGSSVVTRAQSPKMLSCGGFPSIHASGAGKPTLPEERMIGIHDLVLT